MTFRIAFLFINEYALLFAGLWEVCFHNFTDQRYWYPDVTFNSCWWIFEEEYYIIHDLLLRDFFVATQFFFTVTFTFCLIAVLLLMLYCTCSKNHDRFITLLLTLGAIIVSGGQYFEIFTLIQLFCS